MDTLHLLYLPLLFLSLYTITYHFLHKLLNLPPTPFPTLPFIGHLYFFTKSTVPFHRALSNVSGRHGPIVFLRLGSRPVLLVSSPSAAQECLTKNDIVFANRPYLLNGKHFGNNFTSLAWASYGDHWRSLRRISAVELLSSHKLNVLSNLRTDEARNLIQKVLSKLSINRNENDDHEYYPRSSTVVEMRTLLFEYVYSVVTRMITGRLVESKEAAMFREIVAEMSRVTLDANVVDFLPFMRWFGFGDIEGKMRLVQEKRERFMESVIERAEIDDDGTAGGNKQKSLIRVLRDLQRAEPEFFTDDTIRNLLLVLVHGASHTSATTLEWAFSHLLQNPDILTRAQSEIDKLVGKDRRLITSLDLPKIPYLGCIINETLRMHPAAPLLTPHISSEPCTVGGFHVPRGTILLVNAWDIQNNPQIWNDPEKFMPGRFERADDDHDRKNINHIVNKYHHEFKLVPFGWGRRACPGENMAMDIVGLALGSLIQCFEWEKVCGIDMSEAKGVITPRVQPLRAKCTPRPFLRHLLS